MAQKKNKKKLTTPTENSYPQVRGEESDAQTQNKPGCALLTDQEIEEMASQDLLISENFTKAQLDGCCYEFRVGEIAYTYDYKNRITRQEVRDEHIINPMETVTIITKEKVNLDQKHYLFLFSKGTLFSVGLTAVATAADPGFKGHLGITMTNLSMRPIRLINGMGFVKGNFYRLHKKVKNAYVGQHGDATMSWPYPSQFHTEPKNFESGEAEHWQFLPPPFLDLYKRLSLVNKYVKWIFYSFIILLFANILTGPLYPYIPESLQPHIKESLNYLGSAASIIGLLLTLVMLRKS